MDIISVLLRISPADAHSNAFELIVDCAVREEPVGVQVLKAQFSHEVKGFFVVLIFCHFGGVSVDELGNAVAYQGFGCRLGEVNG